jgi:peptide/nickel transport system substrate-binding protein
MKFKTKIAALLSAITVTAGLSSAALAQTTDLKIGNFLDITSWDPANADIGFDGPYLSAIYDPLVTIDENGEIQPVLATNWEYSEDFLTLTMDVRTDVPFTDGTSFNAEVAAVNLEHLQASARSGEAYTKVTDIEVVDEDTIQINLKERDDTMLYLMGLGRSYMASADAIEAKSLAQTPVGSGPYVLESSVPGSEYHFVKKADHWDADTYPYDKVSIYPIIDQTARHNAMLSGQLNVAFADPINNPQAEMGGWNITESLAGWVGLQILDHDGERLAPLGDIRVRKALNHAFDGAAILQAIGQGAGVKTNQVFAAGSGVHDPELEGQYEFSIDKAKELLADAGYADGFEVSMPMSPIFAQWQPVVQQTFNELGIDVTWDDMQMPDYQINAPKYPMFIAFIALDSDPVANFARQFSTPQWYNPAPDYVLFSELTDMVDAIRDAGPEEQIRLIKLLNKRLTADLAWWVVWYQAANTYHSLPDISVTGITGMMFPTLRFIQPK